MITSGLIVLLLAAGASNPAPAEAPPAEAPAAQVRSSIKWESNFATALSTAKAIGKPVLIDFWAEWCGYCRRLDRTTYRAPDIVTLSRQFVVVKVNTEGRADERAVASRYLVNALPTILFVTPGGRPFLIHHGYMVPERFSGVLGEALKRAPPLIEAEAVIAKDPTAASALVALGDHEFEELIRAAKKDPQQHISRFLLKDAIDLLKTACASDHALPPSDRKHTRTTLGMLRGYEGKFVEAEALLKESLAITPPDAEDSRAYSGLGEVYMMSGKTDQAREVFGKVVQGYPNTPDAQLARQYLDKLGTP